MPPARTSSELSGVDAFTSPRVLTAGRRPPGVRGLTPPSRPGMHDPAATGNRPNMSRYLYALGAFSHRRRWWVLGTWLAVLIAVAAAGLGLRGEPTDDFSIPGTESQRAVETLSQKLPAFGGAQTQITFAATGDAKITD